MAFGRKQVDNINQTLDSSNWFTVAIDVESYLVMVNLVSFKMSGVHSAATKLKVFITRDQDGDDQLITETESNILPGKTTPTTKCAVYRFNSIVPATDNDTLYVHAKVNSNTATLERVFLSYEV